MATNEDEDIRRGLLEELLNTPEMQGAIENLDEDEQDIWEELTSEFEDLDNDVIEMTELLVKWLKYPDERDAVFAAHSGGGAAHSGGGAAGFVEMRW